MKIKSIHRTRLKSSLFVIPTEAKGRVEGSSKCIAYVRDSSTALGMTVFKQALAWFSLLFTCLGIGILFYQYLPDWFLISLVLFFSIFMIIQGSITLLLMLYAWNNPEQIKKHKSPKILYQPRYSFTALIPARCEEKVIGDTIAAISKIKYPSDLKEVVIICHESDMATIREIEKAIKIIGKKNIKLVTFQNPPINKANGLNVGLQYARNDVVVVFDAEDEPHKDIYRIINTVMMRENADVVQSGVQLMNYRSNWFSTLNVLEYFFWFKSALHFFAKMGVIPLGGNTVFFKREWLNKIGGWDETCLTEDADIGLRLSIAGAKIKVVYDEHHVTKEETPPNLTSFIHQRTRWNQGFIQVLLKGNWLKLPTLPKKLLAFIMLCWPCTQAFLLFYFIATLLIFPAVKLPIGIVLISFVPAYILFLQKIVCDVALYEFAQDYKLTYPWWLPGKILITFIPFYFVLGISSLRALYRLIRHNCSWEKTPHINAHRKMEYFMQDVLINLKFINSPYEAH